MAQPSVDEILRAELAELREQLADSQERGRQLHDLLYAIHNEAENGKSPVLRRIIGMIHEGSGQDQAGHTALNEVRAQAIEMALHNVEKAYALTQHWLDAKTLLEHIKGTAARIRKGEL